jgi:hypothetical protein
VNASARAVLLGAALLLIPRAAVAGIGFPGAIQDYLERTGGAPDCAVPCMLCHTRPAGGTDYVKDTGFTKNLREIAGPARIMIDGLVPKSIELALDAMAKTPCPGTTAPCNSDGEGGTDLAELHAGTDPDGKRNFDDCLKYGCGASIVPSGPERSELGPHWLVIAFGAAAAVRRAPRRRR